MFNSYLTALNHLNAQNSTPATYQGMLDLHGLSVAQAERSVKNQLTKAEPGSKWRFVTGRGNHVNAKGNRGVLYSEFRSWLETLNFKEKIASVTACDGFYEVEMTADVHKRLSYDDLFKPILGNLILSNIEQLTALAKSGDIEHQILLAQCYYYGVGEVKVDYKQAVYWFRQAANQGDKEAEYYLGTCYWIGRGIRRNDTKAIRLLESSAKKGFALAELQLGDIYRDGKGAKRDWQTAVSYYAKAAKHGSVQAMRKLAEFYSNGYVVQKDIAKAFYWNKQAADKDDAYAQYNVGVSYLNGFDVEQDMQQAIHYFQLSAENGDLDGQCAYGHYLTFIKPNRDEKNGLKWLTNAAQHGNGKANFLLYIFYKRKGDESRAAPFLQRAADANYIMADFLVAHKGDSYDEVKMTKLLAHYDDEILQLDLKTKYHIIDLLTMNDSTKKEKEKGMRLLAHLAKENCKHAQARLGLLHLQGEIVKKDPKKVMQYWKAGAVQGHIFCIISLAHLYQEGKEISKDDKQAFYYFEQATKQNDAHAYNMLGLYLTAGRSVPKDVQRACACFEAAYNLDIKDDTAEEIKIGLAFKGKKKPIAPFAAFNLGRLYCYGNNNFRSNDNWAIYWLKRAVEQGHESAIELLAFVYYKSERYEELFITFKAWAENGNVEAMFILGLFLIGSGQSHGLYWMNAAAMKGHPKAASFLEQRNAEDSQRSVTMYNVINSLKANSHELITTEEASRTVENIVDAQSKHLKEEVNASYTISTAEIKAVELTEEVDTSIQPIAAPTVVAQANSNPNIQPKPVAVDNKPRMSSTTFFSIGAAAVAVVSVVAYNMM